MSTKIKLFLTVCLISIQSVSGMTELSVAPREELDLILQSKNLSFTAILAFQDENFERSSEYFLKSLELRKQFQFGSVAYMNILKLYIHSENNRGGSSVCSSYYMLSYKDKMLLEKEADIQEILKSCE
jgi:hypothetical protein